VGGATETTTEGPATVVIAQRIRHGREDDVRRWQERVDQAVAPFTGYLGSDISTAGPDGEWTVIYRFDSKPHLASWLSSTQRDEVISQGAELFEGTESRHVLIRDKGEDVVTIMVSHPVEPEAERDFLDWQRRVTDAERRFPGFQGAELFRPVPGIQDDWTALYRFDTDEHVDAWLDSPQRHDLLDEGRRFQDFKLKRISAPFGSWFAADEAHAGGRPPARWKTAFSVLVGLYPTVVLLTLAISEIWPGGPLWATLLIGNILSVSLLTWVVMPIVTRALRFWLAPDSDEPDARLDARGAVASVAFLTLAALVFWLITRQVWHLP
jgi:hypothetical protein